MVLSVAASRRDTRPLLNRTLGNLYAELAPHLPAIRSKRRRIPKSGPAICAESATSDPAVEVQETAEPQQSLTEYGENTLGIAECITV